MDDELDWADSLGKLATLEALLNFSALFKSFSKLLNSLSWNCYLKQKKINSMFFLL